MAARLPIMPSTSIYSRFINTRSLSAADLLASVLRLQSPLPGGHNITLSRSRGGEVDSWAGRKLSGRPMEISEGVDVYPIDFLPAKKSQRESWNSDW